MKKWLHILAIFALASCASIENPNNEALYASYLEYKSVVESRDESLLSHYISRRYLEVMNEDAKHIPKELGLEMPLWKYLAKEIRIEYSHIENMRDDSGCLTINGLDKFDRPSSLSLYYIKERGYWVFDNVMVTAHDSIMEYYTEPTCPGPDEYVYTD